MHPLAFKIKRVHHGILSFGRYFFRDLEHATPARFDLLYALDSHGGTLPQSRLREQLGVAPPTLTKMLNRLEDLGIVFRTRAGRDKRSKTVRITLYGRQFFRRAASRLLRWDQFRLIFECFFGRSPSINFERVQRLYSTLTLLARHLRDHSQLEYLLDPPPRSLLQPPRCA